MGLGSIISGLPYALNTYLNQRRGGNLAVKARGAAADALAKAEAEAAKRDRILAEIERQKAVRS
jgi:hypothetical protein